MAEEPQLFNFAQTFFLDPGLSDNAIQVQLTAVNFYFMYKPDAFNNRSGTINPGVTIYLAETKFNKPMITQDMFTKFARLDWVDIQTSSDASVPTKAIFNAPIKVFTGLQYALVFKFDSNEAFWFWTAKNGMWEVNTRNIYNQQNGNFNGSYYEFVNSVNMDPALAVTAQDYDNIWKPLGDTSLKFCVYAARYFTDGVPIVANNTYLVSDPVNLTPLEQIYDPALGTLSYLYRAQTTEHIGFDINTSQVQAFVGAQKVYQNTVFWPGGYANSNTYVTVTVNNSPIIIANTTLPNGAAFNWDTGVFNNYSAIRYLVLSKNDDSVVNIRKVQAVINATAIQVDEPVTWTANNAKFMISPIATIDSILSASPYGRKDHFMFLTHSNANSTVRFVNNSIGAITASGTGNGYSNSDVLYIKGFENVVNKIEGGYVAVANLVTNSIGGITSVYLSNLGCGFVNSAAIVPVLANSSQIGNVAANTSVGTGATFTYTVGTTLKTELTPNIFKSCIVANLDINDIIPFFQITVPIGSTYKLALQSQYYVTNDFNTVSGLAYYVYPPATFPLTLLARNKFVSNIVPISMSYSNEFITKYANGSINDMIDATTLSSNNVVLRVITTNDNDFTAVTVDTLPTVEFGKFIVNNDYTLEETNSGNAYAKHLTTTVNFSQLAEDIRVYMDVYKPIYTDLQVYARLHNSGDPQTFNTEDFTRLECVMGSDFYSSTSRDDDYVEMTWGFQAQPNTAYNVAGTVATTNNQSNVVGSGTTFTSNVTVGQLVKVYDPLFPNTNFVVCSVNAVVNNTLLTLDQVLTTNTSIGGNPALIQNGMLLDVMGWGHQAYTNKLNSNVVRYYNLSTIKYDGYDQLQLKVILLSGQFGAIPRIHDIRCVGVSA